MSDTVDAIETKSIPRSKVVQICELLGLDPMLVTGLQVSGDTVTVTYPIADDA